MFDIVRKDLIFCKVVFTSQYVLTKKLQVEKHDNKLIIYNIEATFQLWK